MHFKNGVIRLAEVITGLSKGSVAFGLNEQMDTLLKAKMLEKLRTE